MLGKIEWLTEYSSAELETVRAVEKILCIQFPNDYLNIALDFQGGDVPVIVFVENVKDNTVRTNFIAQSFSALLQMLE